MDLDALSQQRRDEWERLDKLSRHRSLSGADADEFVSRYRAASADLADMKTSVGRSTHADYLSTILARARLRLTGAPESILRQVPRFFLLQFPAALYRLRRVTAVIAVVSLSITTIAALWISGDPQLVASLGERDFLQQLTVDFVDYYGDGTDTVFAATVWTNNAWLAAQCVMFGITGLMPVYVLVSNAVAIGKTAAVMISFDRGEALVYIIPHGLLELTCLFVAAAAGLQLFWAMVVPGNRTRSEALAAAGRSLATIAIGLVFALALAGLIEGFVTARPWPWAVRIGIGVLALALFLSYMLVLGKRAYRQGETGDVTEYEAGTPTLYAG